MTPARSLRTRLCGLRSNREGAAVMEFGIVAPVMVLLMLGAGDLLYGFYTRSILIGAVQAAGRNGTLQANASTTATTALDNNVMAMVRRVAPAATFVSSRQNYTTFSDVDKPEPFTDKPGGTAGVRDANECYTDMNGNLQWDSDGGRTGVGGANDVAQYTITITYPRLFPLAKFIGLSENQSITARTLLKNQPYASQSGATPPVICP